MSKYTAEQVRACILAYKNGDLNYCRSGIVDLLTEYASILDAEGDGVAVGEEVVDRVAKAIADAAGHGMREKCEHMAHAAISAYRLATWPENHPARSGVVRDEDVEAACCVNYESDGNSKWDKLAECWKVKHRTAMRAALEHFAKSREREDARDAARWRFFCDNIGSEYGDGYSEPRENSACLEWQQGPWIHDGSNGGQGRADTFPGWSAIIDKMMEDEQRALEELDDPTDAAIQGERHER